MKPAYLQHLWYIMCPLFHCGCVRAIPRELIRPSYCVFTYRILMLYYMQTCWSLIKDQSLAKTSQRKLYLMTTLHDLKTTLNSLAIIILVNIICEQKRWSDPTYFCVIIPLGSLDRDCYGPLVCR